MIRKTYSTLAIPFVALALLCACGGGRQDAAPAPVTVPTPKAATTLVYTNPTGTGWRLLKDASSTATHLVLNLVGPEGETGRGVGFNLQSNGSVKFARTDSGEFVNDLAVFLLRNPDLEPTAYDPVLRFGGVQNGGRRLSVGLYQKDRRQPAVGLGVPLCQVAIDLDPALGVLTGANAGLAVTKAKALPADLGTMPPDPSAWDADFSSVIAKSHAATIQIAVGSLVLQ